MPSNWLYFDTNFPTFTGEESTNEKITTVQNYLFMLVEQLRYSLHNLDAGNFNATGLLRIGETITDPVYARIEDAEGNITELGIQAQGLALRLENNEGSITELTVTAGNLTSRMSDAEGNVSALQQTARTFTSQISDMQGDVSTLQQTAQTFTSQISDLQGNYSAIYQTVNGLYLSASNGKTSSTLSLMSGRTTLSSASITLTGMVTFSDLSGKGTTEINGANLMTGTVVANYLVGETVGLRTSRGALAGYITITGASSSSYAIELHSGGALRLVAGYGDAFLSTRYNSIQLSSGYVQVNDARLRSGGGHDLGDATYRWGTLYAQTGEINTSDANLKNSIEPLPQQYLDMWDAVEAVRYKMNDGTSGRYHTGFIAQQVEKAMETAGVDSTEFGGFVIGHDEEGNDIYMLRYEEFIAITMAKVKQLEKRLKALEEQL